MMNILGYIKKNTVIKVILIIEAVLILLYVGLICIRGTCNYTFEADSWQAQGDLEEHKDIDRTENSSNLTVYSEEPQESITVLTTENFKLYPGSYRIKIDYLSQVNYDEGASLYNSTGSLSLKSEKNSVYFSFPDLKLRDSRESVQQTVQITSPYVISDVSLSVQYTGQGELAVYSIQVEEILAYRFIILFAVILFFVLLDVACYYLFFNSDFRRKKEMGVLILICFGAALPFLAGWNFDGHDYSFHMNRILCLSEEIANGNFFPAIFSTALNDYGYANPLFYGQLFLYIPALLYNGGVSLSVVYNIYIILVSIATCLITYYCALKIFKRSTSALFASALYTLSAVRLTNILTREAVGEYTAQTFLPLVILGFYYIYTAPKGRKISLQYYWPIIVGLTGILVSHVLTAIMSILLILLVCIILIRRTLQPRRLFALLKAAGFTILLNLATIVPLFDSMRMDIVQNHSEELIQENGTYLIEVLNPIVNNYQRASSEYAQDEMSLAIGLPIVLGLIFFLVFFIRYREKHNLVKYKVKFASVCWALSVLTIALSTIYIFYDYLNFLPESLYSILTVYQFPWRWLTFATLFGVFCAASVIDFSKIRPLFKSVSVPLLICCALVLNTGQIYSDQLATSNEVKASNSQVSYTMNIGAGGEYLLDGTDLDALAYQDLYYDEAQVAVSDYSLSKGIRDLTVENNSENIAEIDIPVQNYANYIAYDTETNEIIPISTGDNNRIRLSVPAHYSGTIEVKYHFRQLWIAAIVVSSVTGVYLILYHGFRKKRRLSLQAENKNRFSKHMPRGGKRICI